MIQRSFYRILKNRRANSIQEGLRQTERIVNNTLNRIQKKSPNEIVDEKVSEEDLLKQYNRTRKSYMSADKRLPFNIGDKVRILIKKKGGGLEYKSYKNLTYSAKVFTIEKRTQGRRGNPIKYRVNKTWMTQDRLIKSADRDQESEKIIKERDEEQEQRDLEEEKKEAEEEQKKEAEREKIKAEQIKAGTRRRTRPSRGRTRLRKRRSQGEKLDYALRAEEEARRKSRYGL